MAYVQVLHSAYHSSTHLSIYLSIHAHTHFVYDGIYGNTMLHKMNNSSYEELFFHEENCTVTILDD